MFNAVINKKVKHLSAGLVTAVLMTAGSLSMSTKVVARETVDKIVAIVDTGVILQSEITTTINRIKANAVKNDQAIPDDDKLKEQILEQLIRRRIQLQMAANTGFRVEDSKLDQTIEMLAKQDNLTVLQFRQKLVDGGEDFERYREELREEVTINEVKNGNVRRRVYISPQEVSTFLKMLQEHGGQSEEFNLGHILLPLPSNPDDNQLDTVKKQAEKIIASLRQGADFKEVAMTVSSGSRALEGGEMGYLGINEMPTLFAEAVKSHKIGDIVGPLQSGAGLHILSIFDIKGRQTVEVTEVKSRHILIKPSIILSEEKAKRILNDFKAQIISGKKTFGELAKAHSEDTGSALKDGVMDFADPEIFVPAFKEQVQTLPVGTISEPFRSDFGWHIVEVMERRVQDATEARKHDTAYRRIFNRKFNEEVENWMHEIRSQAYVEILPEN